MKKLLEVVKKISIQKILIVLFLLSIMAFADAYLISIGSYSLSEFLLSAAWFFVVIITQGVFVGFLHKKSRAIAIVASLIFLVGNCVYFTFLSSSWGVKELIAYSLIYVAVFLLSVLANRHIKILSVFLLIKIFAAVGAYFSFENKALVTRSDAEKVDLVINHRNIYIIGFDALVSREALKKIFNIERSPAYEWLEQNGFQLKDIRSAGDQTLTTYGSILSLSTDVHPRTVRRLFNGSQTGPLYKLLKNSGYKIQFNYENDYFGVGPGKIDLFYPESADENFCEYKDKRWGYYICSFIKRVDEGGENLVKLRLRKNIENYLNTIKNRPSGKWFSIVHFWFPGHTLGGYGYDKDFLEFKGYYESSQVDLKYAFEKLTSEIAAKDPSGIIIFHGDHGAYAYKGRNMNAVKDGEYDSDLDSRSVLFAAPKNINYCINRYDSQVLNYIVSLIYCN